MNDRAEGVARGEWGNTHLGTQRAEFAVVCKQASNCALAWPSESTSRPYFPFFNSPILRPFSYPPSPRPSLLPGYIQSPRARANYVQPSALLFPIRHEGIGAESLELIGIYPNLTEDTRSPQREIAEPLSDFRKESQQNQRNKDVTIDQREYNRRTENETMFMSESFIVSEIVDG